MPDMKSLQTRSGEDSQEGLQGSSGHLQELCTYDFRGSLQTLQGNPVKKSCDSPPIPAENR